MPVHWPTVYAVLQEQLPAWQRQQARQAAALEEAWQVWQHWAAQGEAVAHLVATLVRERPELGTRYRLAWPLHAARWDAGYCPAEETPPCTRPAAFPAGEVWAADGSQITPDRHSAVLFGLVNVGLVRMTSTAPPEVYTRTWLYLEPDLAQAVGEEAAFVATQRDLQEVHALAEAVLAQASRAAPAFALVDGPLELWRRGSERRGQVRRDYAQALQRLTQAGVLPAGYVDRPRSTMMVHTLALLAAYTQDPTLTPEPDLSARWPGLTDATLWALRLQPGQRSPLFRLWTPVPPASAPGLDLAFFYLRLPRGVARVDLPLSWAHAADAVAALHRHLWYQMHLVPGRFYPYILLRAHEVALVTYEERRTLEGYLQRRLAEVSGQLGQRSSKQQLKDAVGGRTRPRAGR